MTRKRSFVLCNACRFVILVINTKIIFIMKFKNRVTLPGLVKNIATVVGLVLVWRGIWYVLDGADYLFFGGSHAWTAFGGIVIGLLILYIPDGDLKEIEKL